MLFKEMITVYVENHKKPNNTLREKNAELLNFNAGGTYSSHCALEFTLTQYLAVPRTRNF
jgi:hypothetical protein